jgi:hypothetical protein
MSPNRSTRRATRTRRRACRSLAAPSRSSSSRASWRVRVRRRDEPDETAAAREDGARGVGRIANSSPTHPAIPDNNRPSTIICRARRQRPAPTAMRTAICVEVYVGICQQPASMRNRVQHGVEVASGPPKRRREAHAVCVDVQNGAAPLTHKGREHPLFARQASNIGYEK